jgi:drug/metabolite transporter (DMT)-like permease
LTAAIAFALAASLSWGGGDFIGSVKSRTLGVLAFLVPAQLTGLALALVVLLATSPAWPGPAVLYAVPSAVAGTLGLAAFLRGMRVGAISIVAPLAGLAAVIPVVWGLLRGDRLSTLTAAGIAAAIAGVVLTSRESRANGAHLAAGAGWGLLAAVGWGLYFPPLHAASEADPYWAVFLFRCTSATLTVAALLAVRGALPGRRHLPLIALAGVLDLGGNLLYGLAAERGAVGVTSVLASLYPIVTVALATAVLRERPAPIQWLGIACTFGGIGLISAA